MTLRKLFKKNGYRIYQLWTEHQSDLFNIESVFPLGYNNSIKIPLHKYIEYLQIEMFKLDSQDPDIIIVGSQSGLIPYDLNTYSELFTLPGIAFVLGTKPDAVLLTVNSFDSEEFIAKTIQAIESLAVSKVIGLLISNQIKNLNEFLGNIRIESINKGYSDQSDRNNTLERIFGLPAMEFISDFGQEKLFTTIIKYFGK